MLANEARCSVGVVSAVLNKGGNGVIRASEDTKRRIVRAARKLGVKSSYSPHRVGLYVQHIEASMPFGYTEVLSALVVQEAAKSEFAIEILPDEKLNPHLDVSLDGVIGVGWNAHLSDLGGIPYFPVITINQPMIEKGIHSVSCDHQQQAALAAEYGIQKGHKLIAILESKPDTWGFKERLKGYKKALKKAGIPFDASLTGHTQDCEIRTVLADWVKRGVTLILNFHAQQSLETLHILNNEMGLRIGEKISTITLDDLPVVQYLTPPQTAIHQSLDKLATAAVSLMSNLIAHPEPRPVPGNMDDIRFSSKLIERLSVKDLLN
jgi:LacI family transcriptional regulator